MAAKGGVWHKKHREAGIAPPSIDTEAGWTKSGWHGWVYGWKLHLVTTVARSDPLAARPPRRTQRQHRGPGPPGGTPAEVRHPGRRHYNDPWCADSARPRDGCSSPPSEGDTLTAMMASRSGASPSTALSRYRELQRPVQGHLRLSRPGPTRGLVPTTLVLGARSYTNWLLSLRG